MLEKLTFFALRVPEMSASLDFYTDVLGLEIDADETVPGFYTQFILESAAGLALIHGLDQDGMDEAYDIALKVNEIDAFHAHLIEKGVTEISEPRQIPWGRTFVFRTPDGHTLRAYSSQPIEK